MSRSSSFRRKIVYLVVIIILLGILSELGRPGGMLSERRERYKLSQSKLGQIDPTGATIKLATLGMRGIAANILWEKANTYKMKKDWTNLSATLEQVTKLQPNFITVWRHQAWNLSYNVSVEFDDFRQRYHWVIRGINFLRDGIRYNDREPRLLWDTGWFISQKIGRSDERRQFRRLFKMDDDFHDHLPFDMQDPTRDNWLVGKRWFQVAQALADEPGMDMQGKGPLLYRSDGPMCQMSYAENLEKDGTFGEVARQAWKQAADEWYRYGGTVVPTSFEEVPTIHLNDLDDPKGVNLLKEIRDLTEQLKALQPGLYDKMYQRRLAQLTDEQRQAWEMDPAERTPVQRQLAAEAEQLLTIEPDEIAAAVDSSQRRRARELNRQIEDREQIANVIRRYRYIVNFDYWRLRADAEQKDGTLNARNLIHQGSRHLPLELEEAREDYRAGLTAWRGVLDEFPDLVTDTTFGRDLLEVIEAYRWVLRKLDDDEGLQETYGKDFVLRDIIELHEENRP